MLVETRRQFQRLHTAFRSTSARSSCAAKGRDRSRHVNQRSGVGDTELGRTRDRSMPLASPLPRLERLHQSPPGGEHPSEQRRPRPRARRSSARSADSAHRCRRSRGSFVRRFSATASQSSPCPTLSERRTSRQREQHRLATGQQLRAMSFFAVLDATRVTSGVPPLADTRMMPFAALTEDDSVAIPADTKRLVRGTDRDRVLLRSPQPS